MVSDKLMKQYLGAFSTDPLSMQEICIKLNRPESNVRPVLKALLSLNLIERVDIHRKGAGKKPVTKAWKKV